ncbi:MAG: rane bound O-acyl transferase family protein [Flavipsychrobacter sp.]|nr:rane bound O-acyl transferase family protein [Flavipsychrobacter sp.]
MNGFSYFWPCMTFNSLQFLVFFMVVTLWFFSLKGQKGRIWLLLLASCYFYMSFIPEYILILGGTIVIDYFAGIQIERSEGSSRRSWLIISLIANIGVLAVFKYYNFFIDNINTSFLFFGKPMSFPLLKMALPIGLSFHTFQAMSYTIEVYRKNQPAERNFIVYSLYVMFYPQLVAGPIERPQNVLPQLKEFRAYDWDNVKEGLARMLWGFFKKAVIADRLAMVVDRTFSHTSETSSIALFIGAVFYSFQIYCDFSGYSDIAIGAARVMNIRLMENFKQPYLSSNITTFWGRWHVSLSSWFRDYLYIPLGGNRKGEARRRFNVFLVFLLSGLWHGANWTFIVWGLLHGLFVILTGNSLKNAEEKGSAIITTVKTVATFVLVTFLWIFFRSQNVASAFYYIRFICSFKQGTNYIGISHAEFLFSLLVIAIMLLREKYIPAHFISSNKRFYAFLFSMIVICYLFGVFIENQFIYFQF